MSQWSETIFKSYDVRGLYPSEINEAAAEAIGLAIANLVKTGRVVVGRDMRLSSPQLHEALIKGLIAGGLEVDDLEMVPIDAVYFAVGTYGYQAGVMVTASHNPADYNGFKVVGQGVSWIRGRDLKKLVAERKPARTSGSFNQRNIWPEYLEHVWSFIDINKLKPLKIVIDAGNGLAGKVIPLLMKNLPCRVESLFFELDGSFPNRPSNPLMPGAADEAKAKVLASQADLGIMFDGDTDRVFLIDELGNFVPADVTLLLLAKQFINRQPGAGIAYNLICSRAVPEFIAKWGGRPIRSAVGYVNVGTAMKEQQGVMGGELSAHYSFKDNFYADSGFIAALLILELLSLEDKPLSLLVKEYKPYAKSPEINLAVSNTQFVLQEFKKKYHLATIEELDGVTVSYDDWWCNMRPSNTEPLLRITIEADTEQLLVEKKKEVVDFVKEIL
ncbi:phosphomannomutase/phosphoglucomutase [Patescibacteria group bacterium]|nr:phosphomannomutase/phosphoglucomutase [Patescibacteria group bacterium]